MCRSPVYANDTMGTTVPTELCEQVISIRKTISNDTLQQNVITMMAGKDTSQAKLHQKELLKN